MRSRDLSFKHLPLCFRALLATMELRYADNVLLIVENHHFENYINLAAVDVDDDMEKQESILTRWLTLPTPLSARIKTNTNKNKR